MKLQLTGLLCCLLLPLALHAQEASIRGRIVNGNQRPIAGAQVVLQATPYGAATNDGGEYHLKVVKPGAYTLVVQAYGFSSASQAIQVDGRDLSLDFTLDSLYQELQSITIAAGKDNAFGITRLRPVEGVAIYAAKKSEVIVLEDVAANLATNNARQVFAKVAGLNIWESDAAGIQLGIGARGLNPKRTTEFNTRQNGYDMSADALGYPESYYTPPTEALEKIEVVRGAASLQYGTQFGGMINFVLKKGSREKPFEVLSRQTLGSYGLFSSFNSVGGTKGKVNYYSFYQHKRGHEWRPNSGFVVNTGYASVNYQVTPKFSAGVDVTLMGYEAQQPGGLTDAMFAQDPRQSIRARNWFAVTWNLAALNFDYHFSGFTRLNSRTFGLLATRKALGNLGSINRTDPMAERDLLWDAYRNFGNETRFLHTYNTFGNPSTFLVGTRYYQGLLDRKQGLANDGSGPDFYYLNPDNLENSDYRFPSRNFSAFVENVFAISPKLSVTPGIRFEYIRTASSGYYRNRFTDQAGNVLLDQWTEEQLSNTRSFALFGLGASYRPTEQMEVYANVSQNYRAINFNDMRVVNPNFRVDPNLKDERGYNADLGFRGKIRNVLDFDASLFYLSYQDRIGAVLREDTLDFTVFRYRTNVADSRNVGIETFVEADIWKLLKDNDTKQSLSLFSNVTFLDARYLSSQETAYRNKRVELVPSAIVKLGATFRRQNFQASYQYTFTGKHFTDATNTEGVVPNAVIGAIPSYYVMDLSLKYGYKKFIVESGCNNLTNNIYFTRRADAYPGPGIIPANPRTFYVTLGVKL
jgi:Fe(3+) dicitrate transport protein